MKVNIGITQKNLKTVSEILTKALSDQHILYIKLRNYHWNITSSSFTEHHRILEEQYTLMEASIDETAERLRTLGLTAQGSMASFLKNARLKEATLEKKTWKQMFQDVLEDHEATARQLRKDIETCDTECEDIGTADFLTGLLRGHEKMAWFLRNYFEE